MFLNSSGQSVSLPGLTKRYFTVAEANKALDYIERIVADIREVSTLSEIAQDRLQHPLPGDDLTFQRANYEALLGKLSRYIDELFDVGVDLVDYESGLVDFLAIHDGREICLTWKPGEKQILYWREMTSGINARLDLSLLTNNTT